ncbi:MAG: DegT/DnrJ/EryC1/StrS aminotransferase family protein [Bacteroidales bacterium]|nr:DegT/DnrJ/EryC1/StrS aminotransferase family protein [Bacteroidales bacterium]
MIPFSPPRIDDKIIAEVVDTLKSGWITTGPKTKLFEKRLTEYTGGKSTLCVNSATAGLEIALRWFGVTHGDEVIVPAYTYCATANVVVHCGAKPVMVDINADDFDINVEKIRAAITDRTKVIMPVDIAGMPCDYDDIMSLVNEDGIRRKFSPNNEIQKQLGRIMVLADSSHSIGAIYKGKHTGSLADVTVFSFHAVKNLTTAEGGAVIFNLPEPFDNNEIYKFLCVLSLHGQNKDALAKTKGNWKYDVITAGFKMNMTDIMASMGLVELARYDDDTLVKRKKIFDFYTAQFKDDARFVLPVYETENKRTSYHVYTLRVKDASEEQRNEIIRRINGKEVSVNVHFQPLPLLSFYSGLGYKMSDYPQAYDNYKCEISLPVYYDLTDEQMQTVANAVKEAVTEVMG